jgi:hypothetical protein
VIKTEQDLPGTERGRGKRVGEWGRGEKRIMYARVIKKTIII